MAPGGLEKREVYMEMRGIRRMLTCSYGPEGITRADLLDTHQESQRGSVVVLGLDASEGMQKGRESTGVSGLEPQGSLT